MTINELIEEAERLHKKATPGPWYHVDALTPEEAGIPGGTLPQVVIDSDDEEFPPVDLLSDLCKNRDYEFIARSRTLLPLLVKVIKNQQRQIGQLYKQAVGDLSEVNQLSAELEDIK